MKKDGNGIVVSSGSLSISENAKRRMHLRFESYDLKSDIQMLKFKNYEIWRKHLSMSLFDYFKFLKQFDSILRPIRCWLLWIIFANDMKNGIPQLKFKP